MKRLLILLLLFFVGICLSAFAAQLISFAFDSQDRSCLLLQSVAQCILAFALPAWLASRYFTKGKTMSFLEVNTVLTWQQVVGVIILFVVSQPMLNQIINWNASLHLPDSMSQLESAIREMEEIGEATTMKILGDYSVWGLVSGIVVVGVLTGICEEVFFRGALQNTLASCGLGKNSSIWIAAIVFSTLHFQFFGFVPRMLMGAMFGYLLVWTRSLWTSAFAHSLNNSMVVVVYWLNGKGLTAGIDFSEIGVTESSFPFLAVGSTVTLVIFLFYFRKYFFRSSRQWKRCELNDETVV